MTFGERIKSLRVNKKMSMDDLVETFKQRFDVSLSKSMISRWENDIVDPGVKIANIYSQFFNVSLDYLILGEKCKIETMAAHHDGDEYTEEELAQIEQFKRFVINERIKNKFKK